MINTLARLDNTKGTKTFFRVHDYEGTVAYSYRQTRLAAAALAKGLAERGVGEHTYVACSMFNCAEFVFLALAAAYGIPARRIDCGSQCEAAIERLLQTQGPALLECMISPEEVSP
jgi:long-subunit acyl-CoA synthetase (AMP-forming)